MTTQELVILRGAPGSGKTTWAEEWQAAMPKRARVSRDDLRAQLFGAKGEAYASYFAMSRDRLNACEVDISAAEEVLVLQLLKEGNDVVVDNTHAKASYVRKWLNLAQKVGVKGRIHLIDEDLSTCILHDAMRDYPRGEEVVRRIYGQLKSSLRSGPPEADNPTASFEEYVPNPDLPGAWIVDLDGTLAIHTPHRSPYDTALCGQDTINPPVAAVVRSLYRGGFQIVYASGREEKFREITEQWLRDNILPMGPLHMRPTGDQRNDAIVKLEMFRDKIAPWWHIAGAIDDRNRVVDAWRSIGLTCLQVADGDF